MSLYKPERFRWVLLYCVVLAPLSFFSYPIPRGAYIFSDSHVLVTKFINS